MNKDDLFTLRWYFSNKLVGDKESVEAVKNLFKKIFNETDGKNPDRETPALNETASLHLAIVVGHEANAPGASLHGGGSEYEYNKDLAELISNVASAGNWLKVTTVLRDGIGIGGAYKKLEEIKPDCAIELHFNAFNKIASGTETLCSVNEQDKIFAGLVQEHMCLALNRAGLSRGLKVIARSGRGGQSVYSLSGLANCLVEPFFGDNPLEAELARNKKKELAAAIVVACQDWGVKTGILKKTGGEQQ